MHAKIPPLIIHYVCFDADFLFTGNFRPLELQLIEHKTGATPKYTGNINKTISIGFIFSTNILIMIVWQMEISLFVPHMIK